MPQLKLYLLGEFHAALDDLPLDAFRSNKTRALLAYLAIEGQRPIPRRQLATLFWEGYHPKTARASLRATLTNLRQLLGPLEVLTTTYRTIQFDTANSQVWCDAQQLVALMETGDASTARDQARDLYRGEFLTGFEEIDSRLFQIWLWERREYYLTLVEQRAPLSPPSSALSVTSIPNVGLPGTATTLPKPSPSTEKEKKGTDDLPLAQYFTEHSLGLEHNLGERLLHNLPRRLTPLIGRAAELQRLHNLLVSTDYPLITVLGEGGMGKSSLALAAASQVRSHFPDGVWLIDLSGLEHKQGKSYPTIGPTNPQNAHAIIELHNWLAIAVGEAIGLSFHNTTNPLDRLVARLRTAHTLLILDGYESFLESADFVLQLMRATEKLKILITSRRSLNLSAEHRFLLQALPTPTVYDPDFSAMGAEKSGL